ncbi:4-hydroxythreonine-4-phosphate dehydrogenase, partial [Methylopila musalis]
MTLDAVPGRPLALSMGEPAGIGLDLALTLWSERERRGLPAFVALGDPAAYADRAAQLAGDAP